MAVGKNLLQLGNGEAGLPNGMPCTPHLDTKHAMLRQHIAHLVQSKLHRRPVVTMASAPYKAILS